MKRENRAGPREILAKHIGEVEKSGFCDDLTSAFSTEMIDAFNETRRKSACEKERVPNKGKMPWKN